MADDKPDNRSRQSRIINEIDLVSTIAAKDQPSNDKGSAISLILAPMGQFLRTLATPSHGEYSDGRIIRAVNAWAKSFVTEAKKYEAKHSDTERPKRESVDFK